MELLFHKQRISFNHKPTVKQIVEQINKCLNDTNLLSHLVVDGVEVFEETENYLTNHLENIEEIEVISRTQNEFINDILISSENYLKRAIPELSVLTNGFYNNPTYETWIDFNTMLEGIQWISQVIVTLDQLKEKPKNWEDYLELSTILQIKLKNLEESLENGDNILLADIIYYEIVEVYEGLKKVIQTTIDTEGSRYDVN